MKYSEKQVLDVLERIIHPSSNKDIVGMGLVKDIRTDEGTISFALSFPTANDPLKNSIKKACEQMLKNEFKELKNLNIEIKTPEAPEKKKPENPLDQIKSIVAISSGKGGVGKSTVATNLAVAFASIGAKVGLIDADIFGPSIPKMFGVEDLRPEVISKNGREKIVPVEKFGVKLLSIGFFIDPNDATVWRGPMASNALKQLVNDGDWGPLDYLFIDLPPGTSDIHITVSQDFKLSGAIVVGTPQKVALADVRKGINMFTLQGIKIPVLGLVENMAWFTPEELPDHKYYIFGKGGCEQLAKELNIPLLGQIPIVQSICEDSDKGTPTVLRKDLVSNYYKNLANAVRIELLKRVGQTV
jgi:ATP-binding protein involved in chromosome partitioning